MIFKDQNQIKRNTGRFVVLIAVTLLLAILYVFRLSNLQITKGADYAEQANKRVYRTVPISATRGEILDRYGRPFVTNKMGFSVIIDRALLQKETQNEVILRLLEEVPDENIAFTDSLPVSMPPYEYLADAEDSTKYQKQREKLTKQLDLEADATAQQLMDALVEKYDLAAFTRTEQRHLAGVRYAMELSNFSLSTPFTFATDVDLTTVTAIKERYTEFQGVDVLIEPVREFTGTVAAQILGQVGPIFKDEAEDYLAEGYQLSDTVGKEGIERTMEQYLRGKSGVKTIEQNKYGTVTNITVTEEAVPGNNIVLTLDRDLQETAENSLEKTIQNIASKNAASRKAGWDANAGSAVVLDVKTGEVLAMASYPSYDPATYYQNFTELSTDPDKPMFNRAIGGAYAPGSTFKMATAIAGLESGTVTPKDTVTCRGVYTYYSPYNYLCWLYTDTGRVHGTVNVVGALKGSCNYYFYEVARLAGIDVLVEWCEKLGFGQKTGIELPGESAGILASPAYREKQGQPWYSGDTLQAAIGQSYHLITPLQLCNYVATIVNGGTRYQPHLVKSVKSYRHDETILEVEPTVVEELGLSDSTWTAVMEGMRSVTEDGTASSVFRNYPIKVGGKTGTASVSSGSATGVFVCFAPYDDPEIAIAVVVEHGAHGNTVAPVARDIMDVYFAQKEANKNDLSPENTLIP
ncbi:penicillin-binding protein 2 [Feifania hominis]|uniref:Penicillin-binding protein 2 n=1 Tax=Feifania hominis TaxID=2763660 RepID=A0A926HVL9_9FIRM|nr:penicillin-binding protein 2 [Feifania hominis]MBC8537125.1 penicillin-binding protein 2 [Feifania hominis]